MKSKPSFESKLKRGTFVDGFFEFKHEKTKKYIYLISNWSGTILNEWINRYR